MIERKIVGERMKELQIQEYITQNLKNSGHSHTKLQRTPLGEKIIIFASRPGLIVGRKGQNIKKLTMDLKRLFNLENPQIEISEVENSNLDAQIVAERIAASLEKYGSQRFKGIVHKVITDVMGAGALGIEIKISGKVPSSRAKSWRFYQGYMKKCGDIALTGVNKANSTAKLKSGIIGVKVSIMPPTTKILDQMKMKTDSEVADAEAYSAEAKEDQNKKEGKKSGEKKEKKQSRSKKKEKKEEDPAEEEKDERSADKEVTENVI
ncbi:MAG: 30S ribosomal protein S3 [Candidatus Woesearchaeota archaeon]|nr:30S ribosomal protein S3 [Candidatus Woesearchaeota archaeon]